MPRRRTSIDVPSLGSLVRARGQVGLQLADGLRHAIRSGALKPGDLLPSTRALAGSLGLARGTVMEAFEQLQVVITCGTQQGLYVAAQLLLEDGDAAWAEDPAYPGLTAILTGLGARSELLRVPVDEEGMDVDFGVRCRPRARVAFVTPSHQYPIGMPMSMARRSALLSWARRHSAWIVEDDYDSELRYAGHPFPALQGLDPARVLYLGTFSKILFPSLRLGYAVVPERLVQAFVGARALIDRHPPTADQHVLAAFMQGGHLEAHVRRIRAVYAARRAALVAALKRRLPKEASLQPSDQGMHLVVWLGEGLDDVALAAAAAAAGIAARPTSPMYASGRGRSGLILGFGGFTEAQIEAAVDKLARIMIETRRGKHRPAR